MKLIHNWKDAGKFLSVKLAVLGGTLTAVVEIASQIKSLGVTLPPDADKIVMGATIGAMVIGRVIRQPSLTPVPTPLPPLPPEEAPRDSEQ